MGPKTQIAEETITPGLIGEMRGKIGLKLRIQNAIFNECATKDNIRKFVDGIGDINPLYRDEEYAQQTTYGCLVTPPSFVFVIFAGMQFGWRGLAGYHSASEMEFYKPIKAGDRITPEETYLGFEGPKRASLPKRLSLIISRISTSTSMVN